MALLDTQVAVLANQAMNYLASGKAPTRLGNAHPNIVPYQVFAASDGHLIIATGNDGQYHRLCALLGLDTLASDPRFLKNADRVKNRDILVPLLSEAIAARPRDELLGAMEKAGIPAGPINRLDQVFADPQVIARGLRLDLESGGGAAIPGIRSPIVIDGAPAASPLPSPVLGEADRAVRAALAAGTDPWAI
jgi:crotonobetainyl-CoA:carnitine CoA-transferase CaiB-like acyl-CoA transferase